eukprot:9332325-Alexandrium_andersonii.AAC.1
MSASLVGSEMCIRDRPFWPPSGLSVAGGAGPLRGCPAPWVLAMAFTGPVSYTHLTLPTICSV